MKRIFPQNEKRGYITMKTLTFNMKKVFADMETVTVKVPATVDGKAIFETCYPWQATFLVTLWLYYCVAFEAAQYMQFAGYKAIAQKFYELSSAFHEKFIRMVNGPLDEEVPCNQCCHVLTLDGDEGTDWEKLNKSVVLQLRKIAESLVSFMEANNMDSHLSHEVLYDLNNI